MPAFSAVMVVPEIVATSFPVVMLYAPLEDDETRFTTSIVPLAIGVHAASYLVFKSLRFSTATATTSDVTLITPAEAIQ